jgi:catechol 2,3-dioxygenase-like lactoylglutathione lyase family enzyme
MLGDYPIDVVLLTTDLETTRDFYRDKIGLELLNENANAVTFKCGSNQLAITRSTVGTADEQTQAA